MKKAFLLIQIVFIQTVVSFGQYTDTIFPKAESRVLFDCPRNVLKFQDDENDSLDITPTLSFIIDRKSVIKDGLKYYRFAIRKDTLNDYVGLIRQENDKIFVIPIGSEIDKRNELLLFNFNATVGKSWRTYSLGIFPGDSIKFGGKSFNKEYNEYVYHFETKGINTTTIIKDLYVAKEHGLIKVVFLTHYGYCIECKDIK